MFDQKTINEALEQVLKSNTFSKATTTCILLKFLVESTLQEKEISAITIGIELFGKKYDPEKSDVNIRVNISHLRKRLKQYYEEEGKNDSVIISIEPGQYKASFTQKESLQKRKREPFIAAGAMLILTFALILFNQYRKPLDRVWKPAIDNKLETTLYLGDVFGYSGPTAFGRKGWHRDSKINSADEFYEMTKTEPEKYADLVPGEFSYVVFENAFNIKPFAQYFTKSDYDFSIRPVADFKIRSIKDRNTIYAGPLFIQSPFNGLFNQLAKKVSLKFEPDGYGQYSLLTDEKEGPKLINMNSRSHEGEYALAASFNGPNNTRHSMFFSNHGMGLTAVVEYFTNVDSLHSFSKRYLQENDEFVCLFFVKGKERTSVSMEMVLFDSNK